MKRYHIPTLLLGRISSSNHKHRHGNSQCRPSLSTNAAGVSLALSKSATPCAAQFEKSSKNRMCFKKCMSKGNAQACSISVDEAMRAKNRRRECSQKRRLVLRMIACRVSNPKQHPPHSPHQCRQQVFSQKL